MVQQSIALCVIIFLIFRLIWQKRKNQVGTNEFIFWLVFWFLAGLAIVSLKEIDRVLATLGFSSTGIDFLQYIAIVILFYFIFRMRLKIEKLDRNMTKLVREIAIKDK